MARIEVPTNDDYTIRQLYEFIMLVAMKYHISDKEIKLGFDLEDHQWYIIYGANAVEGVSGFGDSLEEALLDFFSNWKITITDGHERILLSSGEYKEAS
jgi:hypothetical protein